MITSIDHFRRSWTSESSGTRKLLAALTDNSLGQRVADDHRTLGRIAWHIIQGIPEMACRTGLNVDGPRIDEPVPLRADEIRRAYDRAASSLLEQVTSFWKDESLQIEDDMYGFKWKRGETLMILITHEIHHRGQMTVLMRQAGLDVPGIYGPSKEEWSQIGMQPPEI